ncbi:hypothetical protein M0R45_024947 [Rubus argutus]|uniref:Leucine-rich repeat-containing N-terminal plant-type domain-containing protein n=1 Tax=Rubus argutus TaxID=59490 RepID=A0AAW1WTB3_RUBAR
MSGRSMHSVLLVGLVCLLIASSTFCSSVGSSNNIMCLESERNALLQFKQGLVNDSNVLASWESNKDCCEWRGIACNNQTGHVITLNLSSYPFVETPYLVGAIDPSLLQLQQLNYLDLSFNDFGGMMIPKFIGSLSQLKELKLAGANFSGPIPPQFGNLSNLHTLDLSYNYDVSFKNLEWLSHISSLRYLNMSGLNFSEVVNWPHSLSKLPSLIELQLFECYLPDVNLRSLLFINSSTSLQVLDLSENALNSSILHWIANVSSNFVKIDLWGNMLQGPIPDVFFNMVSLVSLDLSDNHFEGGLPKFFQNFCRLESLSLGHNQFSENIEDFVKTLSCAQNTLERLYLSGNQFGGSWPDLTGFSKLRWLHLSYNQLNGSVPESLGQLSSLKDLDLSNNSLNGVITEAHFLNLSHLQYLSVSGNHFSINLSSNWNPPFQLAELDLSSCKVGPDFPKWIQRQRNLISLDLSMNQIQGKVPNLSASLTNVDLSFNQFSGALPSFSPLSSVDLSFNQFSGPLSSVPPIYSVDLSFNQFSGSLPSVPPKLETLILSNNKFSGSLSYLCANTTQPPDLFNLDISENLLSGELPNCMMQFQGLRVLNLGKNKLFGKVPSWLGNLKNLWILRLYGNNFSGELPSFENCTLLFVVDVAANKLSGNIPTWIGQSLTNLHVLRLSSNELNGNIPFSLCNLATIHKWCGKE